MPRHDDDEFEDDDRPRRRRPRDDEDDRAPRSRSRDDDDEDRPRRRRFDDEGPPRARRKSNLWLILGIVGGVLLLCCGGIGAVVYLIGDRVSDFMGEQDTTTNNFKEIGLAVHKHHDAVGTLPNNSYDPRTGKPLLSWRVHLLPYLGEDALYKQFKLDEPWDSINNKPLVARMPKVYGAPKANARAGEGKTFYRGFSHQGAVFEKPPGPGMPPRVRFADVPDGLGNTIFIVDAGEAVEWTKPEDLDWMPGRNRPALGGTAPELPFCVVLMIEGSVRQLDKNVNDTTLRHLIDRRDGNVIQPGWGQ
jgi:hypothetical protein